MKVSVVTIASGRHAHLDAQLTMLAQSTVEPLQHVVVAIADPGIAGVVANRADVVVLESDSPRLPIGHARNLGARTALAGGAEILIFLDVDCLPATDLVERYCGAATDPTHGSSLLCGPVTYLPPRGSAWTMSELEAATAPHPVRPDPKPGVLAVGDNHDLFWSLSFATVADTWHAIGGFHEGYRGYGGEDTDFAATARSRDIPIVWVGGAHAYHQHHPVSSPPIEHLDDIIANSAVFHRRWGRWPMPGWLDEFEASGLIARSPDGTIARTRVRGPFPPS